MRLYRDGTLACTANSTILVGTGTKFVGNVVIGDTIIMASGACLEIISVDDDTHLKVDLPAAADAQGLSYVVLRFVSAAQYRDLSMKIEQFLTDRQSSMAEFKDWVNGTKTGGPNGDGKYPLTDRFGVTTMCRCPALLDGVASDILSEFDELKSQVQALADNPSGYTLPTATTTVKGGVKVGAGLEVTADGTVKVANGGTGGWGVNRVYSSRSSSGTSSIESVTVTINPLLNNTTAQFIGSRIEVLFDSANNWASGGYPMVAEDVFNTQGTGTIDKMVGRLVQFNLTNPHVKAALCFEGVCSMVSETTTVDVLAGFFWPNLTIVPNIDRIKRRAAFINQDPESVIQSYGPYQNANLVELAPPAHPGTLTGKYFTAPYDTLAAAALPADRLYFLPVFIPHRKVIKKLGFNVTTAGAAGSKAKIGLWRALEGLPVALEASVVDIDVSTVGLKDVDINVRLNPGTYFIGVVSSAAISITYASGGLAHQAQQFGQDDPLATGASLISGGYAPVAFADDLQPVYYGFTYTKATNRPHLWLRT